MTQLNIRILLVLLTAIVVAGYFIANPSSAFSLREFLGMEIPHTENKPDQITDTRKEQLQTAVKSAGNNDFPGKLDFNEVQKIISVVDENQRKVLLADETAFRNFIRNEAVNKSVLSAAHINKVDQDERNLYIAKRGSENILREIYLKKLIASKIPPDFPTESQLQDYYNQNKDKFTIEERVHVWQIFMAPSNPSDVKEIELLKKQAEAVITDLNKDKIDFDGAAKKYSDQPASKYRGGYMGLIKISDLKPAIKEPLMALSPGKISAPIKTDEGIHILKRGNVVPQQLLSFEEVREQIRQILDTQARNQLRQAIYKQASETYPFDIKEETIEEWRLKLRTNIAGSNAANEQ